MFHVKHRAGRVAHDSFATPGVFGHRTNPAPLISRGPARIRVCAVAAGSRPRTSAPTQAPRAAILCTTEIGDCALTADLYLRIHRIVNRMPTDSRGMWNRGRTAWKTHLPQSDCLCPNGCNAKPAGGVARARLLRSGVFHVKHP